jgi:hypothetical protein
MYLIHRTSLVLTLKILDKSKYFDLTDALIYPAGNVILITSIGILVSIIIAGISWQITCMKEPAALERLTGTLGLGGGNFFFLINQSEFFKPFLLFSI